MTNYYKKLAILKSICGHRGILVYVLIFLTLNLEQCAFAKKPGGFIQSHWLDWATATSERYYLGTLLCIVEIRLTIQISVSVQGFLGISIIWSRYCACIGSFFLSNQNRLIDMDTLLESFQFWTKFYANQILGSLSIFFRW